ncbi:hypothetical protein [Sulfitobacter maritimus]|uniref:hypothetical protein n=1 Tax=Sulfitobacter maritimus TaxID=2741719 RepID=UPI001FE6BF70|nr:hypothetical protein [Sulfitobacter maritimus]
MIHPHDMRWITSLFFLSVLLACNTAGPHFRGLPATRVTVEGSTFDVRVRDELAEAMRINMQYAPRFGPIRARAGKAMALVSGCEVTEVRGDQALALGLLDCGKGRKKPREGRMALECAPVPGTAGVLDRQIDVDITCSAL